MKINLKKAQHEMAGFVIIVLILAIVGVVMVSLLMRPNSSTMQTSTEINNLLQASMYYTTNCSVGYESQFKEGEDLIKSCYRNRGEKCLDGRTLCEAAESTLRKIISQSLKVGESSPNKAYRLEVYFGTANSTIDRENIFKVEDGVLKNCSSRVGGSYAIPITESYGSVNLDLEVCKGAE